MTGWLEGKIWCNWDSQSVIILWSLSCGMCSCTNLYVTSGIYITSKWKILWIGKRDSWKSTGDKTSEAHEIGHWENIIMLSVLCDYKNFIKALYGCLLCSSMSVIYTKHKVAVIRVFILVCVLYSTLMRLYSSILELSWFICWWHTAVPRNKLLQWLLLASTGHRFACRLDYEKSCTTECGKM